MSLKVMVGCDPRLDTRYLRLESDGWEAECLPDIGGKLTSFRSRRRGFEYLWQPPTAEGRSVERPYPKPQYGATYEAQHATGFDECFPAVMPCTTPSDEVTDSTAWLAPRTTVRWWMRWTIAPSA